MLLVGLLHRIRGPDCRVGLSNSSNRQPWIWLCVLVLSACNSGMTKPHPPEETGITSPMPDAQLLRFARLVDGSGEILPGHEIVVANGQIMAVGEDLGARFPQARHIALDGFTALPGLIDAHVHITYGLGGPSHGDAWTQLLQETPPETRLAAARENAAATLRQGITSVRDLFAFDGVDFQLRALIEQGKVPGPRLFLSGMGIHPLVMPELSDPEARLESMRQRANEVADSGAEWLKIFATTGTASDLTGEQVYSEAEIRAATEVAHARGLKVAVHAYGPSAVPGAIRAGVDSIEHAVDVDAATLEAWAASGISYVPTIDHNRYYADHAEEYGYDQVTRQQLRAFTQRNLDMLRRAHEAGVPIVFGSDAVMTMFGENTRELEWFVKAGLSTAETLQTATVNAARLLGQEGRLGCIAVGCAADLIAVVGNPLTDIHAITEHVAWVMLGGHVVWMSSP